MEFDTITFLEALLNQKLITYNVSTSSFSARLSDLASPAHQHTFSAKHYQKIIKLIITKRKDH